MQQTEADAIVNQVKSQLETPGRNAEAHAYTQFVNEVDQYAAKHGNAAAKELVADLSARFQQSGILPRVAAGWLENDFDKIDTVKEDGGLSKDEIDQYKSKSGSPKSDVDAMLADEITFENGGKSQFDDLSKRNWMGASDNIIEKCDLRAYDRQQNRAREREDRHEAVRDMAAPLMEGSPPLMAYLDASHDGTCNGRVSERDMRSFLSAYEVNNRTDNSGNFPYTDENAKYVGDLLDGKYPELTGSNFTGFSARALARRAGLDHIQINSMADYDALKSAYEDKHPPYIGVDPEPHPPGADPPKPYTPEPWETSHGPPENFTNKPEHNISPEAAAKLQDMSIFQKGEGQWHVAKRLLKAGGNEDVNNQDIFRLTNDLLLLNNSKLDKHGRSSPMVHPGESLDIFKALPDLEKHNPKLKKSIDAMQQPGAAAYSEYQGEEE